VLKAEQPETSSGTTDMAEALTSDYRFPSTIFGDVSNICVIVLENMNRDPTSRLNSTVAAIIYEGQSQRINI